MAELQIVNQTLESNINTARSDFSNKIALADAQLKTTEADLEKTIAEAKAETKALTRAILMRDAGDEGLFGGQRRHDGFHLHSGPTIGFGKWPVECFVFCEPISSQRAH